MANPNHSEKSVALDREENITKGNLSAKKVVLYTYDPNNDTLVSGASGFSPHANITTDTSTPNVVVQTDGTKTLTTTISGTTITEVWS